MKTIALFEAGVGMALAAGLATSTHASELLFTYSETGPSAINFSFEQDSNPIPLDYEIGTATHIAVSNWSGSVGPYSAIYWFNSAQDGMFDTDDFSISVIGPQVYGGTEAAPTFAPGTFVGSDEPGGVTGTLVVTSVPEPAAWALMLVGVCGLGAVLRTREREIVSV